MGTFGRAALVGVTALAVTAPLTACGSTASSTAGNKPQTIELVVDVFADQGFGYEDLYTRYMKAHPNIKIRERGKGLSLADYNTRLTQWMASGTGAGDIVALEEGTITQYKGQAQNFVNLLDYDTASLQGNFFKWKWEQGMAPDGKQLIGLGTDVGGLAICYRQDLFAKAGLPTDRDQVAALWPSWEKYIETGKRYMAANTGSAFVDAATNLYSAILLQVAGSGTGYTYYDKSNQLVITSNPDVKKAFDLTVSAIDAKLSRGLRSFSNDWNAGFKNASFATVACPGWMTGVVKSQAGDAAAGKWDVAKAPGDGGNWGGSFLTIPKQSKHPKEAAELLKFLTSKEGQIEQFNKLGDLPSNPEAIRDPRILAARNEYFNNAPTGQIFGASAAALKPVYLGPRDQPVNDEFGNALLSIEQGQRTAAEGWADAVKNGTAATK